MVPKLPIGQQGFRKIRTSGALYVDKGHTPACHSGRLLFPEPPAPLRQVADLVGHQRVVRGQPGIVQRAVGGKALGLGGVPGDYSLWLQQHGV